MDGDHSGWHAHASHTTAVTCFCEFAWMCGGGCSVCQQIGGNNDRNAERETEGTYGPIKGCLRRIIGNNKFHLMKS